MTSPALPEKPEAQYHLGLSSSLDIRARSFGTIKTDQLIEYAHKRFHPEGLFSQKIFGCVKSWHCECGKYSPVADDPAAGREQFGLPYRTVCETCHVLLARNRERRKRFGHIELATPILHPWLWGNSSRPVELLLGLSTRELRRIMRGTRYVYLSQNPWHHEVILAAVIPTLSSPPAAGMPVWEAGYPVLAQMLRTIDLPALAQRLQRDLNELPLTEISSPVWRMLSRRLELVHNLILNNTNPIDFLLEVLPVIPAGLRKIRCNEQGTIRVDELTRRYQDILRCNNSVEKYADNEEVLAPYRRRMSRLVLRLFEMLPGKFPYKLANRVELPPNSLEDSPSDDPKIRNLRRIRRGKTSTAEAAYHYPRDFKRQKTDSIPPLWPGKRVDYSAVSYVVPDAALLSHECGLPLDPIAWELFGTLVIRSIMQQHHFVHSIAKAFVACRGELALEHLTEVMHSWPVVLSIPKARPSSRVKAFVARPVEDKAIHLHPLTMQQLGLQATGETAKVFLPLSRSASMEAVAMITPSLDEAPVAHQPPHFWPSHEALLGCYLATQMERGLLDTELTPANMGNWRAFRDTDEIELAVELGKLHWTTPIVFQLPPWRNLRGPYGRDHLPGGPQPKRVLTTPGRVLLDLQIQVASANLKDIPFHNATMDRRIYGDLHDAFLQSGLRNELQSLTARLNAWGARRLTQLGLSLSASDLNVAGSKPKRISEAYAQVEKKQRLYSRSLISPSELENQVHDTWIHAAELTTSEIVDNLSTQPVQNVLNAMISSPLDPEVRRIPMLKRLVGMTGSVANQDGSLFHAPVTSGLREGLSTSEYFMLLTAQRRGMLLEKERKANVRDIVRQLAPVLREIRVTSSDCQTTQSIEKRPLQNAYDGDQLCPLSYSLVGRTSAETVLDPISDEVSVEVNDSITHLQAKRLDQSGVTSLRVRSPLTCQELRGICSACLGVHRLDSDRSLPGQAIGSQALLALADQLAQVTPTYRFFISRPGAGKEGELKATHPGVISFRNLKVATDAQGILRAVSRKGTIEVLDWKQRTLMAEAIPHGAELHVRDVQSISAGTMLASWTPWAPKIFAHTHATVQLVNLLPGKNVETAIHPQGETWWKVTYDLGPSRPLLVLIDPVGVKLDYFYLPENTWVHVRDGQSVAPGTLLAETFIESRNSDSRVLPGLLGIATPLRAAIPKDRAVLAQCHGQVEVSTLNAQGRCNILVHELTARGKPTKDIYTHPVSPYQRVLVATGDTVNLGQQLASGPISLHDVLNLCGRAEASSRMLVQLLHPLAIQWPLLECHERLWELVLSRLFAKVNVISAGSLPILPGTLIDENWLRKENERLRNSVVITEAGDSELLPGSIHFRTEFHAVCEQIKLRNGKLPLGERPRLVGFRPRLTGLNSAAYRETLPLFVGKGRSAIQNLIQAAIADWANDGNSVQAAMLTGELIPAGTGWSRRNS